MSRKKCNGCGEVKDYAEFSRNKRRKDGLHCQCKSCRRRYYEENREELMEYSRRYREENREAGREYRRRYYEENREAEREYKRRHYEENRESILDRDRRRYEENRESILDSKRRYREEHREVLNEIGRMRRKKINEALREVATRNGDPWTPAEEAYILSSNEPAAIMAMELGRTVNSVHSRAAKLRKKAAA